MIKYQVKGDFSKTRKFLEHAKSKVGASNLDKYGEMGVKALMEATPKDTGETASHWKYKIVKDVNGNLTIEWHNDNLSNNVPIVIFIQYGHVTANGGFVPPNDFINPAMKPVFQEIADKAWKEVTNG